MTAVSVLGLGNMGSALAHAFLARGHQVTVWNRTPTRVEPLREAGADVAGTALAAVEASPLVVVCMMSYLDIEEHLSDGDASTALEGRTLVNLMLGTAAEARSMEAWAQGRGAAYLDGAIPVFPGDIGLAGTSVAFAGDAGAWELHRETLAALGGRNEFVAGEVSAPNVLENTLSVWFLHAALLSLLEAAATARSLGLSQAAIEARAQEVLEVLGRGISAVWDDQAAERWVDSQATLDVHLAALATARVDARDAGRCSGTLDSAVALLEDAVEAGLAGGNLAALAAWLQGDMLNRVGPPGTPA
jgi:3-hydroxyisobutyrate dehydrogenase-like beta-hydroxyacid dehydrogenase